MTWTSPFTAVTGSIILASDWNTSGRDNLNETAPAKVTTNGDLVYATASHVLTRLGIGADAFALRVVSGVPAWAYPMTRVSPARPSADLTLTSTYADVSGASLTITAGTWLVFATVSFSPDVTGGDNNNFLSCQLLANGVAQTGTTSVRVNNNQDLLNGSQIWEYTAAGSEVVKLQGKKSGGTASSKITAVGTVITAIRVA